MKITTRPALASSRRRSSEPRSTPCRRVVLAVAVTLPRFIRRLPVAAAVVAGACAFVASAARAQLVSHTFENGATHGWGPRGPVAVDSSTEVARTGSASLKTTGRTQGWHGPALDLRTLLPHNATYQVRGWVRLVAGQPASALRFTLERTPINGTTTYTQVTASLTASDAGWVQLQGNLALPAEENSVCTLYLESADSTSAYYLDDFTISTLAPVACPEPLDQSGLSADWESGTTDGWTPRGSSTLTNVDTAAHTGSRSLAVTGRTASWNGVAVNALCKLHKGSKYHISLWARLLPGEPASRLRVTLEARLGSNTSYLGVIGNTSVTDAAWVNLKADYTFSADVDALSLYVESESGTASFYVDDFQLVHLPPVPIQTNIPSLKDVLEPYFPVGAALEPGNLVGTHADLLLKHYDQFTAGNSMKWDATEPGDGAFNFARADALANFARTHGLRMRGHTLLWHEQNPSWLFRDAAGNPLQPGNPDHRALMLDRLHRHIQAVVTRYKDIVDSWDVVNEVIDANQPGGLRNSLWLQLVGPDYIDHAFRYAKQYAGDAALFINDYGTENPAKRAAMQTVVQGLLDRSVPVDGVGHQLHINIAQPPIAEIRNTLLLFAGMGLINEVTELDMSVYTNSTDTAPVAPETLVRQGYRYRDLFNLFRELSPILGSVTFWGLGDDTSWLKTFPITRDDKPMPFDEQSQAKPAYWGIVDPTQLPVLPKSLVVTKVSARPLGSMPERWEAIATQPLTSVVDDAGWANLRAGWSGSELYLQVQITDSTPQAGDALEVFLGQTSYRFTQTGFSGSGGAAAQIFTTPTGYIAYVVAPAGQTLAVGGTLKFDVRVTDSATNGQISWSDTRNRQHTDRSGLGTLTLAAEKQLVRTHRGTAVIDGLLDAAWSGATVFETKKFVLGTSGATARARTLWDDDYLYVYVHVKDPLLSKASPNVWEQDSVEIFLDANNGQTTTYQSDDGQYRVNYENLRSFGGAANSSRIMSATRIVSDGYIVEAAISLVDLPTLPVENGPHVFVGFDLQVNNDGAGNGVRSSVATWNDTIGSDWNDTSRYGVLQLVPNDEQGRRFEK